MLTPQVAISKAQTRRHPAHCAAWLRVINPDDREVVALPAVGEESQRFGSEKRLLLTLEGAHTVSLEILDELPTPTFHRLGRARIGWTPPNAVNLTLA